MPKRGLLGQKILKVNGCAKVYEQYYSGHHPNGIDCDGFTGAESKVIKLVIKPHLVFVKPASSESTQKPDPFYDKCALEESGNQT